MVTNYLFREDGEIEVWFVHVRSERCSSLQEGFRLDQRWDSREYCSYG